MSTTRSVLLALLVLLLLAVLLQTTARDQSGFISIDCGGGQGKSNYTDPLTDIDYVSDDSFINTGVSRSIKPDGFWARQWYSVRSFPNGTRNCYKIDITKGSKYLIRIIFLYGNYDGLNELPQFDLLLGANLWDTVILTNAFVYEFYEIIHKPSLDYVQICLANKGAGTPFVTSIEFRPVKNDAYVTKSGSFLKFYHRLNLGCTDTNWNRYKDDGYDRLWKPYNENNWTQLNVSISDGSVNSQNDYQLPASVMSTAATPVDATAPLVLSWPSGDQDDQFYFYRHFMEVEDLKDNQTREFNIFVKGNLTYPNFQPSYLFVETIYSRSPSNYIDVTLKKTRRSTRSPIINAIEIYKLIELQQSDTFQGDVDAVTTIKSVYGLTSDWQGDPCGPVEYVWDGLNCTYGNGSPRITALILASKGLTGTIDPSISQLTMLEELDLSNNNLNGQVPEFLSQLQHLKILNLEGNNFTGSIPSELVEKSKKGSLSLSVDQNLCESGQCNEKKKKSTIPLPLVAVAAVIGLLVLLMAAAATIWTLKRRKPTTVVMVETTPNEISQDDASLQFKNKIYSYSDVINITNNFNTILGKGGFGVVYLGYDDDIPVAVKMLSPSSVQGYQQFQAEVKLLMRVHHRNLTSLIGYCNEGTNKGLIYEYMANGNLQEHLSGKDRKTTFLSWEDRLCIAADAALGLEYLHSGCKPPIIHRDVKSSNILLTQNFQAKISDFGLSKIIPTDGGTHVSTVVAGTPGYLDPEYYQTNRLTEKSDIYSFGIVLLELITSKSVIARNNENQNTTHISQWVQSMVETGDIKGILDSRLEGDFDTNSAWKAVETAMACLSPNPKRRPIMSEIVIELKECLATELARTKYRVVNTGDSVELVPMNLHTESTPMAR